MSSCFIPLTSNLAFPVYSLMWRFITNSFIHRYVTCCPLFAPASQERIESQSLCWSMRTWNSLHGAKLQYRTVAGHPFHLMLNQVPLSEIPLIQKLPLGLWNSNTVTSRASNRVFLFSRLYLVYWPEQQHGTTCTHSVIKYEQLRKNCFHVRQECLCRGSEPSFFKLSMP